MKLGKGGKQYETCGYRCYCACQSLFQLQKGELVLAYVIEVASNPPNKGVEGGVLSNTRGTVCSETMPID